MTYNITINEDKTIVCDKDIIVNQFENEIDELVFELPFDDFSYIVVFKTPLNTKLELPIIDNKIVIGSDITSLPGTWSLIIVGQKDEIVFVSNPLALKSCRNHLNLQTIQEIDSNIETLYLELQEKMKVLDTLDLDNLDTDLEEIKTITNNIIKISSQILSVTQQINTTTQSTYNNILNVGNAVGVINSRIGDNDTKKDGTLFNYTYWALTRIEEDKAIDTQNSNKLDEILSILKNM